ncbi:MULTISPECIES: hypothetical protein [unclassified Streptomyces]|uniref:hypothetical protein n=1 Tax=unclassified Streptomyces TaxID=2593676 RepID=UPI0037F32DE6
MSCRSKKAAPKPRTTLPAVTVCRGTPAEVPRLDHEARRTDLRTQPAGVAMVRRTDCLVACERADVVIIQPSAEGREADDTRMSAGIGVAGVDGAGQPLDARRHHR